MSSDTQVLILAAGRQTRWEQTREFPTEHKQLLLVDGNERIIERIIRQCRNRGVEPAVVTAHPEIKTAVDVKCLEPFRHRWTVETLLGVVRLFKAKRTIVLLGDVVYSWTVMNRIFACVDPVRVFGNKYEIYAVSFAVAKWRQVYFALSKAVEHAQKGGPGKLRKFYQAYCGLDLDSAEMEDKILDRVCWIADYTRDVDTPRDYRELMNKVVRGGLLDDKIK